MTTQKERFIVAVRNLWTSLTPFPVKEEEFDRISDWHEGSVRYAKKAIAKISSFADFQYGEELAFWNFMEYEFLIDNESTNDMLNYNGFCGLGNVEMAGACADPDEFMPVDVEGVCGGGIRQGEHTEHEIYKGSRQLTAIANEMGCDYEDDFVLEDFIDNSICEWIEKQRESNHRWLNPMCEA